MAIIVDIAEAIKEELNATTFFDPFEATRAYVPQFTLEEMEDLHVTVVPKTLESTIEARNRQRREYEIDIAVQLRLIDETNGVIDKRMDLVEEIMDHFRALDFTLPDALGLAQWIRSKNEPIFAPEHIDQLSQFTSIITLTYFFWKGF